MAKESVRIKKKGKSKIKTFFWSFITFGIVATIIGGFFFYTHVVDGLPSLEQLENPKQNLASVVLSADGVEIGRFFRESRIEVRIDSIPKHLINALIATEDKKFREHWGVDLDRIIKGIIKTIVLGKRQGGSTITQQLAKNLYEFKVHNETFFETITRKVREAITAVQIEETYTKDEILEMYFNISYFGRGAYGISMAAQIFFNKSVTELTIPESAVLVALLKSSVIYDPQRRYNNSLQRRNLVMHEMWEDGYITEEAYRKFYEMPIEVFIEESKFKHSSSIAPHYIEYIRQQMEEKSLEYGFNLYEDGLTIYTTLDTRLQKIANRVVTTHLDEFQKLFDSKWSWRKNRETLNDLLDKAIKHRLIYRKAKTPEEKKEVYDSLKRNVAFVDSVQKVAQRIEVGFVVLDSKTGYIKAMVGGRDTKHGRGLNHITQIKRQPGSSFKPIIYTIALDNGLYPAYPILNQPFDYNGWSPTNFIKDNIGGFLTLRDGIKNSVNLVASRLIIEGHVPLWKVVTYARKMGIKYKLNPFPAIALGASEVVPLELVSVYGTIANRGIYNEPSSIYKIEDKDGILLDAFSPNSREAISEETAYMITNMLQTVVKEGTGRRIWAIHNFRRPCAAKTGTNGDYKDAWFMGFTPQLTAGAWVGFDDQRVAFTGAYGQGSKAAGPIWGEFMREAYDTLQLEVEDFVQPASGDIVSVSFCKSSIYEMGSPRLYSDDCTSGKLTDIINIRDIPKTFNSERDTAIVLFDKYGVVDSNSHEAIEIID
jgi:penicillin-binding protein 1A